MKNPEVLADMRAMEETMMIFQAAWITMRSRVTRRLIVIHTV